MSFAAKVRHWTDELRFGGQSRPGLAPAAGGVALLIFAAALAATITFRIVDATDWVNHTYQVRSVLGHIENGLQDDGIAARDRLLSGHYQTALDIDKRRAELNSEILNLSQLVADNPSQVHRAEAISDLARRYWLSLDTVAADANDAAAKASLTDGETASATQQIRSLIDEFDQTEHGLLLQRQATADRLEKILLSLVLLSLVSAAGVAGAVFSSNWSYIAELRAQAAALKAETASRREAEGLLLQSQKLELVGQLTAGIAHDFNNLLTIVIGNLDTARRRLESGLLADLGRVSRSIETAGEGARRAAQLTQRLLAFSRQQPLAPRQLDLNKTVADISEVLTRTVGETVRIETVLAAGLWPAFADVSQVENAIVNLVVNARDAMPEGGRITIETANAHLDDFYVARFGDVVAGQYSMLSVSDTGMGIPPELLPRVFDPFFTTKEVGKGTGLGLAMIHGFVKQSRGHIRIYSEKNEGTTVKIYLPRMTSAVEPAAAPAIGGSAVGEPPRGKPQEVVLIVEDDDGVREFALSAVESLGYSALPARDASEGLALLRGANRIDILFTDVVLPGKLNGRQLADEVKRLKPALPVLFTTGYTRNAIVHNGRLDPDVRLLTKPYALDQLAFALRQLIDEGAQRG